MTRLITITSILVLVSGCVKFEINPGNLVSDTVGASKELYQTIKRKSNGEEERKYTHSVPSSDENSDLQTIAKCNQQVRQIIINSGFEINDVLSESSEIKLANDTRSIQCTVMAVVKKQNT